MASERMDSAWQKFSWASKHMEAVATALEAATDPNAHPIAFDINLEPPNGNVAVVRVTSIPNIRTDYGLALGDTIQNFRSALDHLAWGLVKLGADPKPKNPTSVQFPMATSGKSFRDQLGRRLPGVPREHWTIVRRYQPYRTGDQPKALRWLRNLSSTDKHRVLIPAIVSLHGVNLQVVSNWPLRRFDQLIKGRRALKVGTPLLQATLMPVLGTQCQVNVQGQIACFPSLGYGTPVMEMLPLIRSTVFDILSTFDPLF